MLVYSRGGKVYSCPQDDESLDIQGSQIRLVLGCVTSPLRQHAESRNLGQTLFGSLVPVFWANPVQVESWSHALYAFKSFVSPAYTVPYISENIY